MGTSGCNSNGTTTTSSDSFTFVTLPTDFGVPASADTVNTWIAEGNDAAIQQHSWDIWASLTTSSGEYFQGRLLPVWETWFSPDEIFTPDGVCVGETRTSGLHPFVEPHVNFKNGAADDAVTSFNKYNDLYANNVCDNQYNVGATLTNLNTAFNNANTPGADRIINEFVVGTIATKPVMMLVNQTGLTALPYWDGFTSDKTTNMVNPSSGTWKQCVAVDPVNRRGGGSVMMPCNGFNVQQKIFNLSDFYYFPLSQEEIDDFGSDASGELAGAQPGDYAILVGMHVTVKENETWSWQTFWWTPDPQNAAFPSQARTPSNTAVLTSPWDHYTNCTAYYMTIPASDTNGVPKICFNPYLEPGLPGLDGVHSNCMTCHSLATWGEGGQFGGGLNYQANGYVDFNDPEFDAVTRLDFLWSLTRAVEPGTALGISRFLEEEKR